MDGLTESQKDNRHAILCEDGVFGLRGDGLRRGRDRPASVYCQGTAIGHKLDTIAPL